MFIDNLKRLVAPFASRGDLSFLKAKYNVLGDANPQNIWGTADGITAPRTATLVPPFMVCHPLTSGPRVHSLGFKVHDVPTTLSVPSAPIGLIVPIDANTVGVLMHIQLYNRSVYLRWRDSNGAVQLRTFPVGGSSNTWDMCLMVDKISTNVADYSLMALWINNVNVFSDKAAFCNYGSDLQFVLMGTLSNVATGPLLNTDQKLTDPLPSNVGYSISTFWYSDTGKRYGSPTIEHADIISVTSDIEAATPALLSGTPTTLEAAVGAGVTLAEFSNTPGQLAQIGAFVSPNNTAINTVQLQDVEVPLGTGVTFVSTPVASNAQGKLVQ